MSVAYKAPEADPVALAAVAAEAGTRAAADALKQDASTAATDTELAGEATARDAAIATHAALARGVHGIPSSVGSGQGLVGDGSGGWSAVSVAQYAAAGTFTAVQTLAPNSASPALTIQQNGSGYHLQMLGPSGEEEWRFQDAGVGASLNAPSLRFTGRVGGVQAGSWQLGMDIGGQDYCIASKCDWPTAGNVHDVIFINSGGGGAPNGDVPRVGIGSQSNSAFTVKADPLGRDLTLNGVNIIYPHDHTGYAFKIAGVGAASPSFQVEIDTNNNPTLTLIDCKISREALLTTMLKTLDSGMNFYRTDGTKPAVAARVTGETNDRWRVRGDGSMYFGLGSAAVDFGIEHLGGAGDVHFTSSNVEKLRINNTGVGFHGTAPPGKPTLVAAATDLASVITLANDIRTRLINYGLAA